MTVLIGIAGSIGAICRYTLGALVNKIGRSLSPFPIGTWFLNISGAFLLGLCAYLLQIGIMTETIWLIVGVGFCGAYTTFSTFGTETVTLLTKHRFGLALLYVLTSVVLSLLAAWIGLNISRFLSI